MIPVAVHSSPDIYVIAEEIPGKRKLSPGRLSDLSSPQMGLTDVNSLGAGSHEESNTDPPDFHASVQTGYTIQIQEPGSFSLNIKSKSVVGFVI